MWEDATAVLVPRNTRKVQPLEPQRTRLSGPLQIEERESGATDRVDLSFDQSGVRSGLFRQPKVRDRILECADVEMQFGAEHRGVQHHCIPKSRFEAVRDW